MDKDLVKRLSGLTVSIPVAAEALGICVASAYTAAKRGDFPTVRVGTRVVVPTAPLRKMLGLDADVAA
jgi:hypothetical protein